MTEQDYHVRRKEKEIVDKSELHSILSSAKFMTIAMCKDNSPYLVTVNHAFSPDGRTIYFHCAKAGKKADYISSNPQIWGQVIDDRGYVEGECDYDYRSVMFGGKARLVKGNSEKKIALKMMIEKLEKGPKEVKRGFIGQSSMNKVAVYKIRIESISGKKRVT